MLQSNPTSLAEDPMARTGRKLRFKIGFIFLAALIGMAVSLGAFISLSNNQKGIREAALSQEASSYMRAVEKRYQSVIGQATAVKRLIKMNPALTREEFAHFIESDSLDDLGILAIAWSPVVHHIQRNEFVDAARKSGIFDYAIREPDGEFSIAALERDQYAPLFYVEPVHHSGHLLGLDLFTLPGMDNILFQARDLGLLTMSAPAPLSISDTSGTGLWLHLPIYEASERYPTLTERRAKLRGYISVALLLDNFLPPPSREMNPEPGTAVEIRDLFSSKSLLSWSSPEYSRSPASIAWQGKMSLGQRPLIFSFSRMNGGGGFEQLLPWIALALGLLLTASLTWHLASNLTRTRRIEELVRQRTHDLEISNKQLSQEIRMREQAQIDQGQAEVRYQRIFENAIEGIFVIDTNGWLLNCNPSFAAIFGFASFAELLINHRNMSDLMNAGCHANFLQEISRNNRVANLECQASTRDGSRLYLSINAGRVANDPGDVVEGTLVDITKRKAAEETLYNYAYQDPLTHCLNRRAFLERLGEKFNQAGARNNWTFAVMFIDLDRFKMINDTRGHEAGDRVICEVAARLRAVIREKNSVARLGGDEFAILLEHIKDGPQVSEIADRLLKRLSAPYHIGEQPFLTSGSIGIAFAHSKLEGPNELMRNADLAMYHAKQSGRNQSAVYTDRFLTRASEQLDLLTELRKAAETGDFHLAYQPIVSLKEGKICGAEALLRWNHPNLGQVSPDLFIPIAEEAGLITTIGDWVFDHVLRDMSDLPQNSPMRDLHININISPIQLSLPGICDLFVSRCREYGISPAQISLELTENAIVDGYAELQGQLTQLKRAGFHVLIDDFGTGFASLNQLTVMQWNGLKIDRLFVEGLNSDRTKKAIASAVLSMADTMTYSVTAEGVETEEQRELLIEMGCRFAQGYLFGKPMPWKELIQNMGRIGSRPGGHAQRLHSGS